jgi:anion transporter
MSPAVITIIILIIAMVIFVTEKLPMGVTALLVSVALYVFNIIDQKALFGSLINSNVILILAMCVIGQAFFKTGMAYKSGAIITRFAKTERSLIMWVMIVGGVMSGFLSNTGTVAVLMPIVIGISAKMKIKPSKFLIPLCAAATIGANLSILGSPGNLIAKAGLEEATNGAMTFGFFEYSKIGIPLLIATIAYFYFIGYKQLPDREAGEYTAASNDYSHIPSWQGPVTLIILIATILAMMFEDFIGIPLHISATIGAIITVISGILTEKEAVNSFEMTVAFLIAFMLPMSTALETTGASAMIADIVIKVGGSYGPIILTALLYLITNLVTQFMSNTAACALLVPIAASISAQLGADPRAAIIAVFIGSSVAVATPLAIPANAMVMGPGGYKFKDFAKTGIPVMLICFVLSMILLPILYPFFP